MGLCYQIIQIIPHVYQLHFDSAYDLAMHFVRMQEYYESPKFRKQIFTLVEYMAWYSKEHGKGAFTYPKDWTGFNVPSDVAREVYKSSCAIPDFNQYDERMSRIILHLGWEEMKLINPNWAGRGCLTDGTLKTSGFQLPKFYLIGTSEENFKRDEGQDDKDTLAHELAHALYFLDEEYYAAMQHQLITGMDRTVQARARGALTQMGYHYSVTLDEVQAYCATGLCKELKGVIPLKERKPFRKIFKEFMARCAK